MDIVRYNLDTTACITGRRPKYIKGYYTNPVVKDNLRLMLAAAIDQSVADGYRTFLSGLALGTDTEFVDVLLTARRDYNCQVRVVGVVPCAGQDAKWYPHDKARYHRMLERVDEVVYLSDEPFRPELMHARNNWMIDRSGLVIAAWDQWPAGGTYKAIQYARTLGRSIYEIDTRACEPVPAAVLSDPGVFNEFNAMRFRNEAGDWLID